MIRNRTLLKAFAVFFILEILCNTIAPSLSWALTAGPTAPEATSFEPIDTTDLVNLVSGDLAYNIPLLEVPGPSGGYPLSLSYHAGIQPGGDASWVGLGWTLNPGAIIRNVNGFADDHKEVPDVSRYYWEGGETKSYSIGVTVGAAGTPGSASFGLSYSQDTYKGSGFGLNIGAGGGFGQNTPLGFGVNFGISDFGGPKLSAGIGTSVPLAKGSNIAANLSLGISTNFQSVSGYFGAGVSYSVKQEGLDRTGRLSSYSNSLSLVGASISTGQSGTYVNQSVVGISAIQNSRSSVVSNSSWGLELPVPTPVPGLWLSLGYNVQRYWIDEIETTEVSGSLHFPDEPVTKDLTDNHAYDVFSLKDPDDFINFRQEGDRSIAGTLPNYDNYYVHAQGIVGNIRPYYFQKHLHQKNKFVVKQDSDGDNYKYYTIVNYPLGNDPKPVEFRFVNDFSNRYQYTAPPITQNATGTPMTFSFSGSPLTGENGNDGYINNNLPGSRHIVWLTNAEILNPSNAKKLSSGFIETKSTGFDRSQQSGDLIGAYVITNESGVKYHFALPALSFKEYYYSENRERELTFNEFKKEAPYAYTWYLTAITGPDYVDRGPAGPDPSDWGYWVEFEYGKWTDFYPWRNPGDGMDKDLDTKFQSFSEGVKELYYLDAIRTKSHTALFVKDIRNDAKSSLRFLRNSLQGKENLASESKEGFYTPKDVGCTCRLSGPSDDDDDLGTLNYIIRPTSSLGLKRIILIDNKDLENFTWNKSKGEAYRQDYTYNWSIEKNGYTGSKQCDFSPVRFNQHLYQNVLDTYDESFYLAGINDMALRIIELKTDYNLSPETPNSFSTAGVLVENPSTSDSYYILTGKLTLNEINFLGKGGSNLLPGLKFNYETKSWLSGTSTLTKEIGKKYSFIDAFTALQIGDLLKYQSGSKNVYAVVVKKEGNKYFIRIIGKYLPSTGTSLSWRTTKNPPYGRDMHDIWGLYKSDFLPYVNNENLQRLPTVASSRGVDAWSLRSVTTSTGAEIEFDYESDSYSKSVYYKNFSLPLGFRVEKQLDQDGFPTGPATVYLEGRIYDETDIEFDKIYSVGNSVNTIALYDACGPGNNCNPLTPTVVGIVEQVSPTYLKIRTNIQHKSEQQGDDVTNIYFGARMFFGSSLLNYGGGLRVKSVGIISEMTGVERYSQYEYGGGVTSYEPVKMEQFTFAGATEVDLATYRSAINQGINKLISLGHFIPSPGVMYEFVKVKERIVKNGQDHVIPSYSQYQFEVFKDGMVDIAKSAIEVTSLGTPREYPEESGSFPIRRIKYNQLQSRAVTIKDFSARLGSLKKIILFDDKGNKISETQNHFLSDTEDYETALAAHNQQGLIEETFAASRFVRWHSLATGDGEFFSLKGIITKRAEYPSIQTGQTNINYKSGITTFSKNLAFDFYSGQTTKTLVTDGYGNSFVSQIIPAYTKYAALNQGAYNGKNMLTQEAGSKSYKINADGEPIGLITASVQTWSDQVPVLNENSQPGIWRKHASYTWVGNDVSINNEGLYPYGNFNEFNFSSPSSNPTQWQKTAEITLYDVNSHALEASDVNGNFAATFMSADQTKVIASAANTSYKEAACLNAEDNPIGNYYGGGITLTAGTRTNIQAHTGLYSIQVPASGQCVVHQVTPQTVKPGRTYYSSVWVKAAGSGLPAIKFGFSKDGVKTETTPTVSRKAGSWYQMDVVIPTPSNFSNLSVFIENNSSDAIYFDDFRFHPLDAPMTSYVYNRWGELSYVLDNNNLFTEFSYDGVGRLINTFKESFQESGKVRVSQIAYNYGVNGTRLDVSISKQAGPSDGYTAKVDFGYPPFNYKWTLNGAVINETNTISTTSTVAISESCPYSIHCRITDNRGTVKNVSSYGGSDNLAVTKSMPNHGYEGSEMTFSVNATGSCGPYSYEWQIGPSVGPFQVVGGNSNSVSHTFSSCGNYKVTCTVSGPNGNNYKIASETIYIEGASCLPR